LTGGWDETLISALFAPEDAKTILSIGLGDDPEDRPAWHFDPKGAFSVKSAYKVASFPGTGRKGGMLHAPVLQLKTVLSSLGGTISGISMRQTN
jgi:hypothetical protein